MIYVHVPFCRSFCTYCGFYSEICSRNGSQQVQNRFDAGGGGPGGLRRMPERIFEDYADAVCEEIAARSAEISAARRLSPSSLSARRLPSDSHFPATPATPVTPGSSSSTASPDTLYIGGGTPSVLPVETLARIVRALGPATYAEFTVEVNPDDVVAGGAHYAAALRALGANRISMGVQSFDDGILRWMNRRHDAAGAREAFRLLRAAGFDNISIDLIFGLSHLTDSVLESTVCESVSLGPEHISAYQLSIEEDSALERMVADGRYAEASDEQCRHQYDTLCRLLAAAGYRHYEISNWALPGREAVHNSAYWRRVPYVGLGPAAHSFSLTPPVTSNSFSSVTPCPSSPVTPSLTSGPSASDNYSSHPCHTDHSEESTLPAVPPSLTGRASASEHQSSPSCHPDRSEESIFSAVPPSQTGDSDVVTPCGIRSWNSAELARRDASGHLLRWSSASETLSPREAAEETIMLALRTAAGLPLAQLRTLSPDAPVDALLAEGALLLVHASSSPASLSSSVISPSPSSSPASSSSTSLSSSATSPSASSSAATSPSAPLSSSATSPSPSSSPASSSSTSLSSSITSPSASSSEGLRVRIPEDHFFVSDAIIARLFPST